MGMHFDEGVLMLLKRKGVGFDSGFVETWRLGQSFPNTHVILA